MNTVHFFQAVQIAWQNIVAHAFRSFLTMLGTLIGIASMITLVALVRGATVGVTEQIQGLGSNLISVTVSGSGNRASLSMNDVEGWYDWPQVAGVAPVVNGRVIVKYGVQSANVSLEGVTETYAYVRSASVALGRFIQPLDVEARNKVVLLGSQTAIDLFGNQDPIGQSIMINGQRFQVIGVLTSKGTTLGGSNDERLLIPLSTAERVLQSSGIRSVYVSVDTENDVPLLVNMLEQYLYRYFNGDTQAYQLLTQQDVLKTIDSITQTMTLLLGGIAGISLLVGGIGIMNIMLVSVTERTSEIGLRKAIGAKKRDILVQFLIEAIVLSVLGGALGLIVGYTASLLLGQALGMQVQFTLDTALLAVGFSVAVGILFGLLPAFRASNMSPIEALRYE